jgi:undecaprenyl-diphosphatase
MLDYKNMFDYLLILDNPVNIFFKNLVFAHPWLTSFFTKVTFFGSFQFGLFVVILFTSIALLLFFTTSKNKYLEEYLYIFYLVIGISSGLTYLLKTFFQRLGPVGRFLLESDYSFPSGHSTFSLAFFGVTYYLFKHNFKNEYNKIIFFAVMYLMIILVGLSRLVLDAHYLSDVLAGYMVAFFGLWVGIYVYKKKLKFYCVKLKTNDQKSFKQNTRKYKS